MKTIIILSVILVLIIIAVISFLKLNPVFGGKPDKATMSRILASDNFQDGVFKNLENTTVMAKDQGSMVSTMLEWIRGVEDGKPDIVETQKFNKQRFLNDTTGNFKATWLGHSSILLRLSNKTLLIDPVLSNYASPIPATNKSFKFSEPFTISDLPEIIDILLISHDHYDHLDMPTIKKINQSVKKYLVPLGVKSHLVRWGVEDQKIVELDWWDEESIDGILFACTPARHFSGRSFKRNTTLWCSWVIKDNTSSVYFGADSAINTDPSILRFWNVANTIINGLKYMLLLKSRYRQT